MAKPDFFISHAHEDVSEIARPLADALAREGFRVWFSEYSLRVGDSLLQSIDRGLTECRYGVLLLSPNFFKKQWPRWELDGLVARETKGKRVILPIWHKITFEDVRRFSPILAGRLAVTTDRGVEHVVARILAAVRNEPLFESDSGIEEELQFRAELVHHRSSLIPGIAGESPSWEYVHDTKYRFFTTFNEPLKFGVYAFALSSSGVVKPSGSIHIMESSRPFKLVAAELPAPGGADYRVEFEPPPSKNDWAIVRQHFLSPSFNAIYAEHAGPPLTVHKSIAFNCVDGTHITSRIERFLFRLSFPAGYPIDTSAIMPLAGWVSNSFDKVDERETQRLETEGLVTRYNGEDGAVITLDITEPLTKMFYGFAWNALPESLCTLQTSA